KAPAGCGCGGLREGFSRHAIECRGTHAGRGGAPAPLELLAPRWRTTRLRGRNGHEPVCRVEVAPGAKRPPDEGLRPAGRRHMALRHFARAAPGDCARLMPDLRFRCIARPEGVPAISSPLFFLMVRRPPARRSAQFA